MHTAAAAAASQQKPKNAKNAQDEFLLRLLPFFCRFSVWLFVIAAYILYFSRASCPVSLQNTHLLLYIFRFFFFSHKSLATLLVELCCCCCCFFFIFISFIFFCGRWIFTSSIFVSASSVIRERVCCAADASMAFRLVVALIVLNLRAMYEWEKEAKKQQKRHVFEETYILLCNLAVNCVLSRYIWTTRISLNHHRQLPTHNKNLQSANREMQISVFNFGSTIFPDARSTCDVCVCVCWSSCSFDLLFINGFPVADSNWQTVRDGNCRWTHCYCRVLKSLTLRDATPICGRYNLLHQQNSKNLWFEKKYRARSNRHTDNKNVISEIYDGLLLEAILALLLGWLVDNEAWHGIWENMGEADKLLSDWAIGLQR